MWRLFSVQPPYCGAAPNPGALWTRWNLDPILIAALVAVLALYGLGVARRRSAGAAPGGRRQGAFVAGWAIATAALISPLCPLSVALFSARVGQHMILSLVAAPLVILGRPSAVFGAVWPPLSLRGASSSVVTRLTGPGASAAAFVLALWFWHAPGPYDATFANPLVYWLMHVSVFGAALLAWDIVLDEGRHGALAALAVGSVSTLQMALLGLIITLTPRALYAPHLLTPYAWGLSQLGDQQLGGMIMAVPGCTIFLAATLLSLGRVMSERPPTRVAA